MHHVRRPVSHYKIYTRNGTGEERAGHGHGSAHPARSRPSRRVPTGAPPSDATAFQLIFRQSEEAGVNRGCGNSKGGKRDTDRDCSLSVSLAGKRLVCPERERERESFIRKQWKALIHPRK